tara:strand:+ start:2854 stop:3369 length:516 start_codon:yes stop_codon:yes gene_type:complete
MIPKVIKLILSFILLLIGIFQITESFIGNGVFLIILSILLIVLYFKNEVLIFAFLSLRKQNFERTEKILKLIRNPKSALVRKQQGFYYYLHGLIQSQKNLTVAEKHFRESLKLGLSMNHDIAMAKLSLAGIMMQKRRKREAQALLTEAKGYDKHNMLTAQIKLMQEQMKRI